MTNNTQIYWEASGLSLHTYAWSVRTFGGRRYAPPGKRGEDLVVPFRRGRIVTRKIREAQQLTLDMWLVPLNVDGTRDNSMSVEQKLHTNWKTLIAAFDVDGQFSLVKRWWDGTTLRSATAQAELVGGLEPTTEGGYRQTFSVDLLLADPYFYTPVSSQSVGAVTILGDVRTDHVTVVFTGGTNPRLTTPDGNWVQYQGTPGTPVTVNFYTGMATQGSNYVNGLIVRNSSFAEWPRLSPGAQTLTLTGGGTATFTYDAAYR